MGFAAASVGTLSVLPGCASMGQANRAGTKRPNIIVIISDDMGYADIGETKDLKAEQPDVLKEMEKTYERWNSQMIDPVWTIQRRKRKTRKKKT